MFGLISPTSIKNTRTDTKKLLFTNVIWLQEF